MIFDYSLAGARDRGAAHLSHLRAAPARAVLKGATTMTVIGWIQILLYCAIIVAITPVLGGYMTRVFNGERTFSRRSCGRSKSRSTRSPASTSGSEQHWVTYTVGMLLFHVGGFLILYALMRLQALLPFNPAGQIRGRRGSVVQYRDELHHQHQLAELRRRKHDVLSRADARPDAPELPVGGDRHRARGRADPRLCAALGAHGRQFLGRYHPLHALHPAADLRALRAVPGLAGHPADARPLRRRDDARRRQADHRGRPGRLAGRHQDARHQWRRLLQRQRRASVRESDRAVELRADDLDLRASARR